MRPSRRAPDELRAVSLERGVVKYAEGSCLVKFGDTHVLVHRHARRAAAALAARVRARGWVTAEYGMLPRATHERTRREASAGKQSGRTVEIQRLIGRSLRAVGRSRRRWANARSPSTATCSRPTAAPAPPRSPAPGWRWPIASPGWRRAT